MPPTQPPRWEQALATRAALVAAARRLFVAKGYFDTGTEEIVAAAGVGTRGALYHHFADKKALFLAVFQAVEEDLLAAAETTERPADAFGQLRTGLISFLDASVTAEVQRVLLLDGPVVLGWKTWRDLEEQYGLGSIQTLLDLAVAEGSIRPQPTSVLAHILLAAVDEAALYIANADDPHAARLEAVETMETLFDGLKRTPRAATRT
jgi:AcrR family transcriptional regulator